MAHQQGHPGIDPSLISKGLTGASLFDQVVPGLFAQQQQAAGSQRGFGQTLLRKFFPGVFAPSKKEQATLDIAQAGQAKAVATSAQAISGALNLAGIGDAASLPAVRDTIQAAATGDAGAIQGINALLFQAPEAVAARQASAQQAQDANDRQNIQLTNQLQEQAKRGGMSVELHTARSDRFGKLQIGRENLEDLLTINAEFGREALPGRVRGAYEALRGQAINALRIQFEAGALQEAEIKFFNNFIPEFGVFNTLSAAERRQKLKELQRQTGLEQQGLAETTTGLEFTPAVQGRTLDEIFFQQVPTDFAPGLGGDGEQGPPAPGAGVTPGTGFQVISDIGRQAGEATKEFAQGLFAD